MRYLDVCAGISASSVAWQPLGWEAAAYSEIEAAPRAILEHRQGALPVGWDHRHAPGSNITPLFGDFTQIETHHVGPIDLLVGGTPCQDFSVAGLREGLGGDRGNLTLEFLRLADRTRPRWLVWENVPGVLSIDGGRAFGAILGGLGELGYGFAYRVLDAQHFGVPQRRRRVFVVGYLGDHQRAGAVLFERHSLSGHPAPRSGKGKAVAALTSAGVGTCGADDNQGQAGHLIAATIADTLPAGGNATGGNRYPGTSAETASSYLIATALRARDLSRGVDSDCTDTLVTHSLRGEGFDASEDGTGRGTPLVPVAFAQNSRDEVRLFGGDGQTVGALGAEPGMKQQCYVAFPLQEVGKRTGVSTTDVRAGIGIGGEADPMFTLQAGAQHGVGTPSAVRRLTPRECERLQGFPDDYTLVPHRGKPMADGPRYKALGNTMAVPVMRWIGERIVAVESIASERLAA